MESKNTTFAKFRRLLKMFPKKSYFTLGIIFIVLMSITSIATSYVIRHFLDSAANKDMDLFINTLYLGLGIFLLDTLLSYLKVKLLGIYTESGVTRLRKLLSKKINKLPIRDLEKKHSGDYVSTATNDIGKVRTFFATTVPEIISIPLTAILALIYLCILSWKLTVVSLILTPILILGAGKLSQSISHISRRLQDKLGKVNSIVQDAIGGIEISKSYNLEDSLEEKYNHSVEETVETGKHLAKRTSILEGFSQVLGIVPFFTTFLLGGYWAIKGDMTVGGLLAFINLLNYLTYPVSQFPKLLGQTKSSLAAADRIFEVMDDMEERSEGESFSIDNSKDLIEFNNVNFSYPGSNEKVLKGMNFTIKNGESVALVGPSGGGKSTIIKLLLGYYENYDGDIMVGERELKEWNLNSLRDISALVSQDTFLFPETIETNIKYGRFDSNDKDIIEVAKKANAHRFIEEFKDGYDTKVGQLGNTLSGGQKQRISIARAMIKDAPILLLDEATSALDTESEALVQNALEGFIEDKTSLVIAHRLSTIKNVDRILVLNNGKIVEEGSHDELIKLNGFYTELYNKQLKNQQLTLKQEVV
ncbi:ABC transporter ATP-binding protein [Dethiothermospora halolimnae]|uniref:ABC transporter ATP-binding protein n=1 Tax=Dethiothermospora halolimnae TaxID=3114390 RepID=UPI003CCBA360